MGPPYFGINKSLLLIQEIQPVDIDILFEFTGFYAVNHQSDSSSYPSIAHTLLW